MKKNKHISPQPQNQFRKIKLNNNGVAAVSQNWEKFQSVISTQKVHHSPKRKNSEDLNLELNVNQPLQNTFNGVTPHLAIDCEMVNCEDRNKCIFQALARLSIVNYNGHVILDQYYRPQMRITNYLTSVSGITPRHIKGAPIYDQKEIERVKKILDGRIIVGHSLNNDFKAMKMEDEKLQIRDISKASFMRINGNPQSLKKLCQTHLKQSIQDGSHSSVVDARSAMFIYRKLKIKFDEEHKFKNNYKLAKEQMLQDAGI